MNFFKNVVANLMKYAEEATTSFSVVDPSAVGEGKQVVRTITLISTPIDEQESILSLSWDGSSEKVFEKKLSNEETKHIFDLMAMDLSEVHKLVEQGNNEGAKSLLENLLKKYTVETGDIVPTNSPIVNNTQASEEKGLWKQAKVSLRNIFPSGTIQQIEFESTKDLQEYQGKGTTQDAVPLWDLNKGKNKPQDSLSAPSLSYEDLEQEKEKETKNLDKRIKEQVKTELESSLEQKKATMFTDKDKQLVDAMKNHGRTWDEIKKYLVKELSYDKESVDLYIDDMRSKEDHVPHEDVKMEEKPESLRPPKELVPDEVHEKLLKDIEDKKSKPPVEEIKEPIVEESSKKGICPECDGEGSVPAVRGGRVIAEDCPSCKGDTHITQKDKAIESSIEEISRADNADIRKVASSLSPSVKQDVEEVTNSIYRMNAPGAKWYTFSVDGDKIYRGAYSWEDDFGPYQYIYNMETGEYRENPEYKPTAYASLKTAADDLNPLQEPIQEEPTMETPKQDVVPMGMPSEHNKFVKGDRVYVSSEISGDEKAGFSGTFVSEYNSKGEKFIIVETDEGDLFDVAAIRATKVDQGSGAQEADPIAEPQIEMQQEAPLSATPSVEKLTTGSSQDDLLTIKAEVDTLLKLVKEAEEEWCKNCEHYRSQHNEEDSGVGSCDMNNCNCKMYKKANKISFKFIKKGLEKHADDSAFEGNGWCRVWVGEIEISADKRYPEILKIADESARITALKEIAREIAHESLRLADSYASKIGVQTWFDSLKPSDHDRIDWVALANPQVSESSLKQANTMDTKCEECGEPLGPEVFLSKWSVCGKCTKKLHNKVIQGSDFEKGISQNKTSEDTHFMATYMLVKSITEFNETSQDWSGKYYDMGILEKGNIDVSSMEDAVQQLNSKYGMTFESFPDEPGRYDTNQIENGEGMEDPNGKWLADYSVYIKLYKEASLKIKADEPAVDPKTLLHDVKITPDYVQKEKALPATEEQSQVIARLQAIESSLSTLDRTKEEVKAKLMAELKKIDDVAERSSMEREYQEQIDKLGILINATQDKLIKYGNMYYSFQQEESKVVPKITQKEWFDKFKKRFEGAEKFINDVKNGMLALSKSVVTPTITRWPEKRSELTKEASVSEQLAQINSEMLEALKLLSLPL